jgi:hypothetical protein
VIATLALASALGCQKQDEPQVLQRPIVIDLPPTDGPTSPTAPDLDKVLARLPETTRRDLYCASVLDTMARRPGINEDEIDQLAIASGILAGVNDKELAAARLSNDDLVALFTLRDRVSDDIRRGESKYPVADCLARADALKSTTR